MEQDKKPRNKPTHLWSTNLQQRRQEHIMGKRSFSVNVALGQLHAA